MKAYELLDRPEKWTRDVMARDSDGRECEPFSPRSVCWCVIGAIEHCYLNNDEELTAYRKVREAVVHRSALSVGEWNDHPARTWEEVHSLLRELDI